MAFVPDTLPPEADVYNIDNFIQQPSYTYRLDFENGRIIGKIDNNEAILQAVRKVLNTDRYAYEIYSWTYGNEIYTLFGKDISYTIADLPRILEEALYVDDRIRIIENLTMVPTDLNTVVVEFDIFTHDNEILHVQETITIW